MYLNSTILLNICRNKMCGMFTDIMKLTFSVLCIAYTVMDINSEF